MRWRSSHTVACLSGHGIGPEVMAEASRALTQVSRLHGFRVEEVHPPFGGEAVTQSGHALPSATRRAMLATEAVLVAAADEPALAGVESELDLHARVDRVVFAPRGAITFVSPLDDEAAEWTLAHAFELARASRATVTSVGGSDRWRWLVSTEAARQDCVLVEQLSVEDAVQGLAFEPDRFDVVVAPVSYAEPLVGVVAHGRRPRVVASGRLARTGPSVFAPGRGAVQESAGQGVADPASMLLATALMLGEGLRERRAAETLSGAVLRASSGHRLPERVTTTREFGDVVLSQLSQALTNAEFYREAVA